MNIRHGYQYLYHPNPVIWFPNKRLRQRVFWVDLPLLEKGGFPLPLTFVIFILCLSHFLFYQLHVASLSKPRHAAWVMVIRNGKNALLLQKQSICTFSHRANFHSEMAVKGVIGHSETRSRQAVPTWHGSTSSSKPLQGKDHPNPLAKRPTAELSTVA